MLIITIPNWLFTILLFLPAVGFLSGCWWKSRMSKNGIE